jgi:hypothetical protein
VTPATVYATGAALTVPARARPARPAHAHELLDGSRPENLSEANGTSAGPDQQSGRRATGSVAEVPQVRDGPSSLDEAARPYGRDCTCSPRRPGFVITRAARCRPRPSRLPGIRPPTPIGLRPTGPPPSRPGRHGPQPGASRCRSGLRPGCVIVVRAIQRRRQPDQLDWASMLRSKLSITGSSWLKSS